MEEEIENTLNNEEKNKNNITSNLILFFIILGIFLLIVGIYFYKNLPEKKIDEKTAFCIANKSVLYSQTTCPHCIEQKKILDGYIYVFDIVECNLNFTRCADGKIGATPTWIIDGKNYEGVKSITKLKELTGC